MALGSNTLDSEYERWRCRWCFGCKYFEICGYNGSCSYYLATGNRRGSPFGSGPCPKKVLRKRWKPPKGYDAFCRSNPPKGYPQRLLRTTLEAPEDDGLAAVKSAQKEKARRIGWDAKYAEWLFLHGWKKSDISIVIGVKIDTLYNYAAKHNWGVQDVDKIPKKKKTVSEIRLAAERKWRPEIVRGPEDEPPTDYTATNQSNAGRVQWDTLRAYELWLDGWLFQDIAKVLGCENWKQIQNYAAKHGWSSAMSIRGGNGKFRTPEEIEAEKHRSMTAERRS